MLRLSRLSLFLGLTLVVFACSDKKEEEVAPPEKVEVLYNKGLSALQDGNNKRAVSNFEEVERQHPYSSWATNAQVMSAFASYENEDYDDAIAILERFVKLHPTNENVPYAYYLTALCYYEQISDVGRDQKMTENAMKSLEEVIARFPDTQYARDSKLKLDLTRDHLAGKEMQVGRYYQGKDEYLAAINRFKNVVVNYQSTTHITEALHRLVECYLALGITEEAKRYAAVLGHNYPDSVWYKYSYAMMEGKPTGAGSTGFMAKLKNMF